MHGDQRTVLRPELLLLHRPGAKRPLTLYMRVGGATLDVSRGKRVHLADVAGDGAHVYFTSTEPFLPADEDTSEDLYRWDEATDSMNLLSLGGEGTGNSDDCSVSWTDGCGVVQLRSCHSIHNLDPCEARTWGYPDRTGRHRQRHGERKRRHVVLLAGAARPVEPRCSERTEPLPVQKRPRPVRDDVPSGH